MDKVRKKSKFAAVRKISLFVIAAATILAGAVAIANIDFESRRVDQDTLLIGTVERGDLEIRISANGQLLPRDLELISAQVEGRVARVHVDPGDEVNSGQLLAELTNPQLVNAAAWL